jgi:transcriptional regulator with GAF, ATPase, and Fis domain
MEAKLVAISGPRAGETFVLSAEQVGVIGRDSDWLLLKDPSASRRHCEVRIEAGKCRLIDLESRNGTSINGVPIKERILNHGDRIEIGDSLFLFLTETETDHETPVQSKISESNSFIRTTIKVRLPDLLHLKPGFDPSVLPISKMFRALQALFRIGNAIASGRTIDSLQTEILETIFEFVPAQRGAILLSDQALKEFHSIFALHKDRTILEPVQINRKFALQVLNADSAFLSNDIDSQNENIPNATSVLCAPLLVLQRPVGALYLETSDPDVRFDEDHLQFLSIISGIMAVALENCRVMERLQIENKQLKADLNIEHNMIGESSAMRNVFEFIARVAPSDSTVLIVGETGTGKELVSRAIHQNSKRYDQPFIVINCATLSETLLESELFGHEKGSFTGAIAQKKGKLEIANGGTVFLDEIAEMAPALQAKLLRVLQERQFERVGGTSSINVDIRIIAATNKNLKEAVQQGTFRQDLYYRLNVLQLRMPSLRERVEDIPLLARHFASKYSAKAGKKIVGFSIEARRHLVCYSWPGNVRELENAIERAIVLGTVDVILPEDLPENIIESQPANVQLTRYQQAVKEAKRQLILRAMEQAGDNYVEAASILEIHPNNLHRLIRDLDLKSSIKKPDL